VGIFGEAGAGFPVDIATHRSRIIAFGYRVHRWRRLMTDDIHSPARQGSRTVEIAGRNALAQDERGRVFGDFYYRAMKVSWPKFFASTAVVFLTLNSCFALAYVMGDNPIANTRPRSFVDLFFFSVETLATVGFGDMHPQTTYAHVVATIEIFTGMSFLAVMTGLIFARFSRPRARLVFARNPVVNRHEGQPTLMIRVANARANMISDAAAQLWVVRTERSAEGATFRRFHRLALHRQENPMFILSWTLLHALEASSPLFGQSAEDLAASEATLVLILSGLDENAVQELRARRSYDSSLIRWGYRYADILKADDEGRVTINYSKFHEVEPDPDPRTGDVGS
jgi:inward rectifier potassium channel